MNPDDLVVRDISPASPLAWLARGWRDVWRSPAASLVHGLLTASIGAGLLLIAWRDFWLFAGLISAFLIIAPLFATGLYVLSWAHEQGLRPDLDLLAAVIRHWQGMRSSDPDGYWSLLRFGALLALAGVGWIMTTSAFLILMSVEPIAGPTDFIEYVLLDADSWLFEAWLALGGLLAAPMFASSVVSMPLLLERKVNARQAVLTSWRAVLTNPVTMAVWASLLLVLMAVGLATALLGLILILPWLGHASWHAYRDLVDARSRPTRLARALDGKAPAA